MKIENR